MSLTIPKVENSSETPNALTQNEIADLSASKRNTVLYERTIGDLRSDIEYLKGKLDESDVERKIALDNSRLVPKLKSEKTEIFANFLLLTVLMTIGSALISSYPKASGEIPWQFGLGWGLIGAGVLGTLSRIAILFSGKIKQEQILTDEPFRH